MIYEHSKNHNMTKRKVDPQSPNIATTKGVCLCPRAFSIHTSMGKLFSSPPRACLKQRTGRSQLEVSRSFFFFYGKNPIDSGGQKPIDSGG